MALALAVPVLGPIGSELLLEVGDDGVGLGGAEAGLRLRSMRERAARAGAALWA